MYSVMHDAMIPTIDLQGREQMRSIREIFELAHELRDIRAYSAQARLAVLRLLIVLLMDCYELDTIDARADLYDAGRFDIAILDGYVARCEKDGARFALFSPEHPFMQCAYDPALDAKAEKSAAELIPELASGNNHTFFAHMPKDAQALKPHEAFQGMLVIYLFSTSGAQGYPSGVNLTPPLYVLLEGENLFQTLMMNSLSEEECKWLNNIPYGRGEVPWRTSETVVPKKKFQSVSLLQALTWRPRRITLQLCQETETVNRISLQQGHHFVGNDRWRDPHVPRVEKKDGSYTNLKPELGRALWRDAGTLVGQSSETRPPVVSAHMGLAEVHGHETFDLSMTGLVTDRASILGATCERLAMPIALMQDDACADRFVRDLSFIEDAQRVLYSTVLAQSTKNIARQAQGVFLGRMRNALFGSYLHEIERITDAGAGEDQPERLHALLVWLNGETLKGLRDALEQVVNRAGSDVVNLIRQEEIRRIVIGWYYNRKKEREGD